MYLSTDFRVGIFLCDYEGAAKFWEDMPSKQHDMFFNAIFISVEYLNYEAQPN